MFESSTGVERVSLDYDRDCDLIIMSGFYESIEIPFDDFLGRLGLLRRTDLTKEAS